MSTRKTIRGLIKGGDILITGEEMQRLYLDGKPIRRYCLQCRGPKLMVPPKEKQPPPTPYTNDVPSKYRIVCRTCGMKYWAKVEVSGSSGTQTDEISKRSVSKFANSRINSD